MIIGRAVVLRFLGRVRAQVSPRGPLTLDGSTPSIPRRKGLTKNTLAGDPERATSDDEEGRSTPKRRALGSGAAGITQRCAPKMDETTETQIERTRA